MLKIVKVLVPARCAFVRPQMTQRNQVDRLPIQYSTPASFSNFKNSLKSLGKTWSAIGHLPVVLHGAQTLNRRLCPPILVIRLQVQV